MGQVTHRGAFQTPHKMISGTDLHGPFHYESSSDPGAVGAGLYWLDLSTTPHTLKQRNSGDSGWDSVGVELAHTHASFASAVTFNGDVTIGNAQSDVLTIGSHVSISGTTPSITATPDGTYPAAGTTPTSVTVSQGNDTAFEFGLTTGTTPATGILCTITFATARPDANYGVWLQARTSPAASCGANITNRATTGFDIRVATAIAASTSVTFFGWVIEF